MEGEGGPVKGPTREAASKEPKAVHFYHTLPPGGWAPPRPPGRLHSEALRMVEEELPTLFLTPGLLSSRDSRLIKATPQPGARLFPRR